MSPTSMGSLYGFSSLDVDPSTKKPQGFKPLLNPSAAQVQREPAAKLHLTTLLKETEIDLANSSRMTPKHARAASGML